MSRNMRVQKPSGAASGATGTGGVMRMESYHWMVFYCWLATIVCYVDRTNMSVAMVPAAREFDWDKMQQGYIHSAFFVGYSTTQILGGVLSGKYGGPTVLTVAVVSWSILTVLTPWCASNIYFMILCRVGLGAGEGVAMPTLHNIASNWYPSSEMSKLVSFVSSGGQLGVTLSLLLSPWVAYDWAAVFRFLGFGGILWGMLFYTFPPQGAFTRPDPQDHKSIPWKALLTKKAFWAVYISHFGGNFGYYIIITWLPAYFAYLGVPVADVGYFTIPAYICSAVASNVAGVLSDTAVENGMSILMTRKLCQAIAMIGGASSLLTCAMLPPSWTSPALVSVIFCVALGCHGFHQSGNMVNMIDIAPTYAGETHGVSNTIATFAGIVGNTYVGYTLPTGGWSAVFTTAVVVYIVTLLFFLRWAEATPVIGGKAVDAQ